MFKAPKRRSTRQRSGFSVEGKKSGRQAVIIRSQHFQVKSDTLSFVFEKLDCPLPPQFNETAGIVAVGGYVKAAHACSLSLRVEASDPLDESVIAANNVNVNVPANSWFKFGTSAEVQNASAYDVVKVMATVTFKRDSLQPLDAIQVFGINVDTVTAYTEKPLRSRYNQNTDLYYPEIFYLRHDEPFIIHPIAKYGDIVSEGLSDQVMLKACNRCSRFLPIDYLNENNALGFSNHRRFSQFLIENWSDNTIVDTALKPHILLSKDETQGIYVSHLLLVRVSPV